LGQTKSMSRPAWLFVLSVIITGVAIAIVALANLSRVGTQEWPILLGLVVLTTLSRFFKARFRGLQRSARATTIYTPSLIFVFAGIFLLSASTYALLVIIPQLLDWVRERLKRSENLPNWYIQPFNIATLLIAGLLTQSFHLSLRQIYPAGNLASEVPLLFVATAMVYLAANHYLVGQALVLARDLSWSSTGVWDRDNLFNDFVMLCLGYVVFVLWMVNPWLVPLALVSLLLISRALMVPQLRKEANLFETTKDGILFINPETGQITDVNPRFVELSGYERTVLIGQRPWLAPPFASVEIRASMHPSALFMRNKAHCDDLPLVTKEGRQLRVELSSFVYEMDGERVIHCAVNDITARKRAEDALQRAKSDLEARVRERTHELRQANANLKLLSQKLMRAQEDERRHIARELHDEIGQILTLVKVNLQTMQRQSASETLFTRLQESSEVVDGALRQVRDMARDLRPSVLDDLGLAAAIRSLVDKQAETAGFLVDVDIEPAEINVSSEIATTCFRVTQEGLTNIVRHARASNVTVQLRQNVEDLELRICDDGVGFNVSDSPSSNGNKHSLGLLGMQERVTLVGGHIQLESACGQGTHLKVRMPLEAEPAAELQL